MVEQVEVDDAGVVTTSWWSAVLLRLAYLTATNTFAVLRLFPMSDRDKDTEILALRHEIAMLERQLGSEKVRFTAADRAFLALGVSARPR